MTGFIQKKIYSQETAGEQLRKTRLVKEISLEEVEKKINIKIDFLKALEENDYYQLPGQVYAENFLKKYGAFLKLDTAILIRDYRQELAITVNSCKSKKKRRNFKASFLKILKPKLFICLIALLIVFYFISMVRNSFTPPHLFIYSPTDNLITQEKELFISGEVEQNAHLTVNGETIYYNSKGEFEEKVLLQDGLNIIRISANKKHSREEVVIKKVMMVKEEELKIIAE